MTAKSVFAAAVLAAILSASVTGAEQTVKGEPGLWEVEMRTNLAMFIARDVAKLTPEERAKQSDEALNRPGHVVRFCVTPQQIAEGKIGSMPTQIDAAGGCKPLAIRKTAHGTEANVDCGNKGLGHIEIAMASPKHFSVTTRIASDKLKGEVVSITDAHWISADCGNVKPADLPAHPAAQ
jgi:hypothetical protein